MQHKLIIDNLHKIIQLKYKKNKRERKFFLNQGQEAGWDEDISLSEEAGTGTG